MKLSLSLKIILGVIGILLISTLSNLIYSYVTFNSDKTAYLFESILRKSETTLSLINLYEKKLKEKASLNLTLATNDQVNFNQLMSEDNSTIYAEKLDPASLAPVENLIYKNEIKLKGIKTKFNINFDELKAITKQHLSSLTTKEFNEIYLKSSKSKISYVISIIKKSSSPLILVSVFEGDELNQYLKNDSIYTNEIYLINKSTSNPASEEAWVKQINYKKIKYGTVEVLIGGRIKLLAYSTSISDKFIVASYIDKDLSLSITSFLAIKTILFSFALLGISLAIGIFFASSISYPLKKLTAKANDVAQGKYDERIDLSSTDELGALVQSFNIMTKEIQILLSAKEDVIKKLAYANTKLENYSLKLESMVEQRTSELKKVNTFIGTMINSLDQGLFVFNKELVCSDISTKACENIFGIDPSGKSLIEVLKIENESDIENTKQWANIVFSELINFESASQLGPKDFKYGNIQTIEEYKHVKIEYFQMRDETDTLTNLVAVATDDTSEVFALNKAKEQEDFVSMILKIIKNKAQFQLFCNEVYDIIDRLKVQCTTNEKINLETCMMLFHTLNGGFSLYFIKELQIKARAVEENISQSKSDDQLRIKLESELLYQVETIKSDFDNFLTYLDGEIGSHFSFGIKNLEISKDSIDRFRETLNKEKNKYLIDLFTENFIKEPIGTFFSSYNELCKKLAQNLGKKINDIKFSGSEIRIEANYYSELFSSLVHLFRNCIDHGIESPDKRIQADKDEYGTISVNFKIMNNKNIEYLAIIITDDGNGINPEIIKKKYLELNPGFNFDNLNKSDILNLIFDPFFSTRDVVTAVSGRGVGMSAIKDAVLEQKGQIIVTSEIGIGSKFEIYVPLQS